MKFNEIFSDNLVFAKGKPIRIFGTGKGTGEITFMGETKNVVSNEDFWCVEFSGKDYGGPYELTATLNGKTTVLDNIHIGEVFVYAGQSNLQFKLQSSTAPKDMYEDNANLRLYSPNRLDNEEFFFPKDGWITAKSESVGKWTALGFLASNGYQKQKGVAVGVITCYQGASVIESWLPNGELKKHGIDFPIEEKYIDHRVPDYNVWNKDGMLFEYALGQIVPFSVSAIVWYQGESDAFGKEAEIYDKELEILISCWKKEFNDKNLPFVIVQIANCEERLGEGWLNVQNAQKRVCERVENTELVISKDVCETNDIHPPTKHLLAERICTALIKLV